LFEKIEIMHQYAVRIFQNQQKLIESLASLFFKIAAQSIAENGQFSVVLSGGNSPKEFYGYLASQKNKIDWTKVFFFFGDERNVPFEEEGNNAAMAKKLLFDPLEIPAVNYFIINTALSPSEAAADYEQQIKSFFKTEPIQFDFILLGLGENAHTASLFPYSKLLKEQSAGVKSVFIEEIDAYRITFTAPLINQAKNALFLVFGKSKAKAVQEILGNHQNNDEKFPAKLIDLKQGNLYWFMDEDAASLFSKKQ